MINALKGAFVYDSITRTCQILRMSLTPRLEIMREQQKKQKGLINI